MSENGSEPLMGSQQENCSEDCHDYVFKDGKLVGDFDNMYRHSKEVPWYQDRRCNDWYTEVGLLMLKDRSHYNDILEIGCGLGYIAAKLKHFAKCGIDAFDVSPKAIREAQQLHSGIRFYVDDISQPSFLPQRQYDLVVVKEVFFLVFKQAEY